MNRERFEALKGKEIPVLNEGFVQLIDAFGEETRPATIARVSYGEKRKKREDDKLLEYLWRNGHESPFEFIELLFRIKAPIFVARQWFRHRTGNYAELSGRYSRLDDMGYFVPQTANYEAREIFKRTMNEEIGIYRALMEEYNIPREQARAVLGVGMYTKFYFKMDMRNLLHFLKLRLHPHAQPEIQQYAAAIGYIISEIYPKIWEIFLEYSVDTISLTPTDREFIRRLIILGYDESPTEEKLDAVLNAMEIDSKSRRKEMKEKAKLVLTGGENAFVRHINHLISGFSA